jgi:hypothetical protein
VKREREGEFARDFYCASARRSACKAAPAAPVLARFARETLGCLEVAQALGYLASVDAAVAVRLNRVIGTLVRLVGSG